MRKCFSQQAAINTRQSPILPNNLSFSRVEKEAVGRQTTRRGNGAFISRHNCHTTATEESEAVSMQYMQLCLRIICTQAIAAEELVQCRYRTETLSPGLTGFHLPLPLNFRMSPVEHLLAILNLDCNKYNKMDIMVFRSAQSRLQCGLPLYHE